jgi:hypothetical protein
MLISNTQGSANTPLTQKDNFEFVRVIGRFAKNKDATSFTPSAFSRHSSRAFPALSAFSALSAFPAFTALFFQAL